MKPFDLKCLRGKIYVDELNFRHKIKNKCNQIVFNDCINKLFIPPHHHFLVLHPIYITLFNERP